MAVASDHHEGSLQEEVELLEAIYIHELTIEGAKERPSSISLLLHPSTGDEGEKQYVCLTLHVSLPSEYPNKTPGIHIRNPRGLSDAHVESIISNLRELAESRLGSPMLYELIEYAKESLTDNNIPSCACAICLSHFQDSHCFTKTECYHYFHCSCLARYIEYCLRKMKENETIMNNRVDSDQEDKQIVCPMCRLPITYDLEALKAAPEDVFSDNEALYSPDKKMKQLQKEMAELYDKQFKKGGIINVEEEKNKFLIEIKMAPVQQDTEETTVDDDPAKDNEPDSGKPANTSVVVEQNKSTNYANKGEDRRRERPSSSRKRGRGGQHGQYYRNDGRWNDRSDGPRNERSRSSNERGFFKGQRDREVNQKTQGADKYKSTQRNHESRKKNDRTEESKAISKEMNGIKSTTVQEDKNVQEVTVKSDVKNDKPGDNSEATRGVESQNDNKSASLKMTVTEKEKAQDTRRIGSGYREKRRDKTTARKENLTSNKKDFSQRGSKPDDPKDKSMESGSTTAKPSPSGTSFTHKKENIPNYEKDLSHRENEPLERNDKSRSMNTGSRTPKTSRSDEASGCTDRGKTYFEDKRKRRPNKPKKTEQKDTQGKTNISLANGAQNSSLRNDIEKTIISRAESPRERSRIENQKPSHSDSKIDDKSAAGVVRLPPGFDRIDQKSPGITGPPPGPPPGFENKDSLATRQPPPGF